MTLHRFSRLLVGVTATALAAGLAGVLAPPAAADPVFYWQVEKVRTDEGVEQGAEELYSRVRPVSRDFDPPPVETVEVGEWTVTNTETTAGVLDWAIGIEGNAGVLGRVGITDSVALEANTGVGGTANLSGSRSTTVTRTNTRTARTTFRFFVQGPKLSMKQGQEIWGRPVGNRHVLKARRCTAVPGGGTGNDLCGDWKRTTLFQPTGIAMRYQGLGWSDLNFSASKCCLGDPQPKWITNRDPRRVGQQICPTVTGLQLDVRTSRYRFGCSYAGDPAAGVFTLTAVRDTRYPYDVDSFVAELRGDVVGKVRVTRERIEQGTVRPLTMRSIGALTARNWSNTGRGTFTIVGWEGS